MSLPSALFGRFLVGSLALALALLHALVLLVGLGVLRLELLERRLLGLGALARLLLASRLPRLGLLLGRRAARAALGRERHAERQQQLERVLVGGRRGGER